MELRRVGRAVLSARARAPRIFSRVYARAFTTVEVDSTFYAIPAAKTMRGWAERTPPDFSFALKLPQEITHENRLRDSADLAALFFDRARELGPKLGPILMQLGPDFAPSELPALASFLPMIPRDVRVAVEFRQRGWIHDGIIALLAEHNVGGGVGRCALDSAQADDDAGRAPDVRLRLHPMDGAEP